MNIAFPALVVTLLVLPGILLRYSYRKGFFYRSPVSLGPIQNEIGLGVIGALVINGFSAALVDFCIPGVRVDFEAVLVMLTGWPRVGTDQLNAYTRAIAGHPWHLLFYLLWINTIGLALGYGVHQFVRANRLDLRYDLLRFPNDWYYVFEGEARIFDVDQRERKPENIEDYLTQFSIDYVFLSAVVEQQGEAMLYWGILFDYSFDANGELDKLVLKQAQRRRLLEDRSPLSLWERFSRWFRSSWTVSERKRPMTPIDDDRFYSIQGEYLILRFADIKNLNVEYRTQPIKT